MEKKLKFGVVALVSAYMTLSACGGGSGSGSSGSTQRSATGPITAFGSVYVNGTRYNTDNADVYIEDSLASESDLRVGMMVTVVEDSNGDAASVSFDDDLEGIVTGVGAGTIEVMGQTVTVNSETIFESDVDTITDPTMIAVGNIIEVSGYSAGTGDITATRIEVKAENMDSYTGELEVKGVVVSHSAGTQKFNLGSMIVDYSSADLSDLPNGISDGLYVEVKSSAGLVGGELIASRIEQESDGSVDHDGDENEEYEFTGLIMAIGADTITVNGEVVTITADTEFEDGAGMESLMVGDEVEVEAYFDADGNLIAKEIEREEDEGNRSEFTGTIASIVSSDTNIGTITLEDGTVIKVNNDTVMHDSQDQGDNVAELHFNLTDLMVGDFIEVYASDNGDGTYTAVKIERDDMPVMAMPL